MKNNVTTEVSQQQEVVALRRKTKRFKYNHWQLTLMVLPAVLFVFVFSYLPMGGLIIAFKDYKFNLGMFGSPWSGFANFEFLVKTDTFYRLVRNTLGYNFTFIFMGMAFAVVVALMLDTVHKRIFVKVYQGSMFLPYFLSWIVVSYVTHALLDTNYGIINGIITKFGGDPISFYTETKYWPIIFVIANLWKAVGNNSLIYYGTIMGISPELYESASLDGCGYFGKVRYITLPHLKSTMIILGIMAVGGIFRCDYGMFMFLSKETGALQSVTDVLDTFILRSIRTSPNMGVPSAAGFLQSIVGFITVLTANAIVRKIEPENALF